MDVEMSRTNEKVHSLALTDTRSVTKNNELFSRTVVPELIEVIIFIVKWILMPLLKASSAQFALK
jgi:hypothetical protein